MSRIGVAVFMTGALWLVPAAASAATEEAKLTASDGAAFDEFAVAVDTHGRTAAIAAYRDDVGANVNQGSVYVFVRTGSTWTQQAKLTASDGAAFDEFGNGGVAVHGNTLVVGAVFDDVGANVDQGSAYVFTRHGSTWTEEPKLTASDGAAFDGFGIHLDVHRNTALVGAYTDDVGTNVDQGSAYVFTRRGSTWTEQAKLTASDGAAFDTFGHGGVTLDGDAALVGAVRDDVGANVDQGSAYVFTREGSTWTEEAKLIPSDGAAFDEFGVSVVLHDDNAVVGSDQDDVGVNVNQGSAYVFTRRGSTWTEQAKLTASDGAAGDAFGNAAALEGDTLVLGAFQDNEGANVDQGSAYVFTRGGSTWTEEDKLTGSDGAAFDWFSVGGVSLHGGTALVGARLDDVGVNPDQGSAYVFSV